MLKHIPQKALKTIENDLLYSETKVTFYINDNKRLAHYTRIVELNGRNSMSCPYLLISISLIKWAKKIFTAITPAAILLLLPAADLNFIGKQRCTS